MINKEVVKVIRISVMFIAILIFISGFLFINNNTSKNSFSAESNKIQTSRKQEKMEFNPPRPQDAPASIHDAVMLGYNILKDTPKFAPDQVSNNMSCSNCHIDAGLNEKALPLVGVSAVYPKFNGRAGKIVDLATQTNNCIRGALKGKPLNSNDKKMVAILTYFHWISKGIPVYAKVPWLGMKKTKK